MLLCCCAGYEWPYNALFARKLDAVQRNLSILHFFEAFDNWRVPKFDPKATNNDFTAIDADLDIYNLSKIPRTQDPLQFTEANMERYGEQQKTLQAQVLKRAGTVLNKEQLEVFRQSQVQQATMEKMGREMGMKMFKTK